MNESFPIYPETLDDLEQAIDQGQWCQAWSSDVLSLQKEAEKNILLLLAQTVWQIAEFHLQNEEDNTEVPETKELDSEKEEKNKDPYSILARILIGLPDNQHSPPKNPQEDFEQMVCALTTKAYQNDYENKNLSRDVRIIYLRLVKTGNDQEHWKLCVPSYPVTIHRPIPRIRPDKLQSLHYARKVRKVFIHTLKTDQKFREKHPAGICLLSAILWSGLLEIAGLEALYQKIGTHLSRSATGFWLDLHLYPETPYKSRILRFRPDPVTTAFLLNSPSYVPDFCPEELIDNIVKDLIGNEARALTTLLTGIAQELSLEIPEALIHIATGHTITHPIKTNCWRLIEDLDPETSEYQPSDKTEIEKALPFFEKSIDEPLLQECQQPGLSKLRKAVKASSVQKMRNALFKSLNSSSPRTPAVELIAKWLADPPQKAAASTRQWMFSMVGQRLASLLEDLDPRTFDEDELEHIYTSIIADGKSPSQRSGMKYSLSSFHQSLKLEQKNKKFSVLKELEQKDVSSQVITHEQYHLALKELAKPIPSNKDPHWLEACQIVLILFFRLGLRKNELLFLPLHDIHGKYYVEILIRPHSERNLKTSNALRTLLLNGFLEKDEQQRVMRWLTRRKNEESINNFSFYFLAIPSANKPRIPESGIINRIVDVLRSVTGNPDLHIHHLRHSFATWTSLALLGDAVEEPFDHLNHLPVTTKWLRSFPKVIKNLYPNEAPQRNYLYLVSKLLGHSTPTISLEFYCNGIDLLLSRSIWRHFGLKPSEIGAEPLEIPLRTFFRKSTQGWHKILEFIYDKQKAKVNQSPQNAPARKTQVNKSTDKLFTELYGAWEAVKLVSDSGLDINQSTSLTNVPSETLERWFANSAKLLNKKLIKNSYPELPVETASEDLLKVYAKQIEKVINNQDNNTEIIEVCELWYKHKASKRGALRFIDPKNAQKYLVFLNDISLPWSQRSLTWIGSRQTPKEIKTYKAFWRKELNISRRISIEKDSINNDRPLKKTKGYFDIKVVNGSQKNRRSSKEFNWLMTMLYIVYTS